ncbi:RusA family crossover junction endodeoxyribonuclease [Bradyrhizobium sp. WSM3983]|uniref:RusA family crossover junction endodeoxyribonuclease n=1 Tax=Bradyrhizobium sp. WSM3983 TaxID=1038867 RepID=UPI0004838592|nr:RusA family crossover junction endodeoxyribonuclease [Bradyrhizobium sp. WSM3983]
MEIEFPLEFLVHGTPVSFQAKNAAAREDWKDRVKTASSSTIPHPHFVSGQRMAVTMYYLPEGSMPGDIDNIVKLVLDALCAHIYLDDAQVERVVVQKFEPGNVFSFSNPSTTIVDAITGPKPVLYVKVSDDPFEELR